MNEDFARDFIQLLIKKTIWQLFQIECDILMCKHLEAFTKGCNRLVNERFAIEMLIIIV